MDIFSSSNAGADAANRCSVCSGIFNLNFSPSPQRVFVQLSLTPPWFSPILVSSTGTIPVLFQRDFLAPSSTTTTCSVEKQQSRALL